MSERVSLIEGDRSIDFQASHGATLLEALIASGKGQMDAPCGGKGLCGKCRVRASGSLSPPSARELKSLSAAELGEGWRLACQALIRGEVSIVRSTPGAMTIIAEGPSVTFLPDPAVRRLTVSLPPARLEAQIADEDRLLASIGAALEIEAAAGSPAWATPSRVSFSALPSLALAARDATVDALLRDGEVIAIETNGVKRPSLGIGVDIGTTTVVTYLVDLVSGAILGTRSALNDQRTFGADVISRIAATIDRPDGLKRLSASISSQLSAMASSLVAAVGARPQDLLTMAVAGNTTMLHLFAGVPPAAIAASPFPPAFSALHSVGARELGLDLSATCRVFLLPGVSGYVGADIVSGIAALGMAERDETSLLLDIGTNGEIALGGSSGIFCCATAAGPAFEGSGISMGMGGVEGAIDSVWIDGETIAFSTIGGAPALGLCGSGVLDALAVFLEAGLIDDTGRVVDSDEASVLPPGLAALLSEGEGGPRLALGSGVFLSQADVRQLQLAKAAIAAGVDILLSRAGKTAADVDRVFLAGGFGSYLDLRSAVRIGLLPRELADRVLVSGNTAGAGAVGACLSRARLEACETVRSLCTYVELSSQPDFNEAYMERIFFPERR